MGQVFGIAIPAATTLYVETIANRYGAVRFARVRKLRLWWPTPDRKGPTDTFIPRIKPRIFYSAEGAPLPKLELEPGEKWPDEWREILTGPARERAT